MTDTNVTEPVDPWPTPEQESPAFVPAPVEEAVVEPPLVDDGDAPDLMAIATAAQDPRFQARVRAACHFVGVPYTVDTAWFVAAQNDQLLVWDETYTAVITTAITNNIIIATLRTTMYGLAPLETSEA